MLVEIDDPAAFETAIRAVDAAGLDVSIVPAGDEPAVAPGVQAIELVGQDRPGIVREVTAVLAGLGVNIEEFVTTVENGAWSGELLFRATAKVSIPEGLPADAVRAALEDISGEIMVDFSFAG